MLVLSPLWRSGPNANLYWLSLVPRERPPTVHAPPLNMHLKSVRQRLVPHAGSATWLWTRGAEGPVPPGTAQFMRDALQRSAGRVFAQHIGWVTHHAHSETREREIFLSSSSRLAHDDTAPGLEQCNTGVSSWGASAGRQIPKPGTSEPGGRARTAERGQLPTLRRRVAWVKKQSPPTSSNLTPASTVA